MPRSEAELRRMRNAELVEECVSLQRELERKEEESLRTFNHSAACIMTLEELAKKYAMLLVDSDEYRRQLRTERNLHLSDVEKLKYKLELATKKITHYEKEIAYYRAHWTGDDDE